MAYTTAAEGARLQSLLITQCRVMAQFQRDYASLTWELTKSGITPTGDYANAITALNNINTILNSAVDGVSILKGSELG